MRKLRIAVNGCGRIGRAFIKKAFGRNEIEIVAVNDLADIKNIAYLLKYDTVYGRTRTDADSPAKIFADKNLGGQARIYAEQNSLVIDDKKIIYLSEKEAEKLPWKDLDIDVVVEASGHYTSYEKSKAHLTAGAKTVVISAPSKDSPEDAGISGATILLGVNEEKMKGCQITSNASCTTNAGSPLIAILDEAIGIEKAVLNTVHGYTASQGIVDGPNKKDFREGRAGAQNIVPSSTGAAIAVTKAFPKLAGLFDGISVRVPVVAGSIVDITFIAKRETTKEEVNEILKKASGEKRWAGIFSVTEEELVSSDILGSDFASIADLNFTRVVGGNLVKVMAWYDNEMGYSNTLIAHVIKVGEQLK
jgi:glyceraldehyde 3-phosphate dehydrogenase